MLGLFKGLIKTELTTVKRFTRNLMLCILCKQKIPFIEENNSNAKLQNVKINPQTYIILAYECMYIHFLLLLGTQLCRSLLRLRQLLLCVFVWNILHFHTVQFFSYGYFQIKQSFSLALKWDFVLKFLTMKLLLWVNK